MKGKRILTGLLLASTLAAGFPAAAEETPEAVQPELIQQEVSEPISVYAAEEGESEDPVLAFEDTTDKTNISDEAFYGKYDMASETWVVQPYFNYDKYPEMAAVKQAVMQVTDGDYSIVKEEILEYYRDKRNRQSVPLIGSPSTQAAFFGYAMTKNFYFHPSWPMLGYFDVTGTAEYHSVDVTHQWDSIKTAEDHVVSMIVMASEKDGNTAEFESREAAHPPILEIESNGVVTTLTAIQDATVIAGSSDSKNFGKESTLLAEESVTTIGASEPTDSNTKRAHIQFDISDISVTDSITRVTLNIYGKNATSDEAKEIFVMKTPNNAWEEDVITFKNLDRTQAYEHMAYSWYGEDSVRYMRPTYQGFRLREELERFETWFPMLLGMYVQGTENNESYAYTAIRHWVGWLNQSGTNPRGPGYVIPLDHGCRCIALPRAFAWLIMSDSMTPDIWSATLKYMWKSGDIMVTNNYAINDTNNAGVVAARGLHMMNCYYDEFATYDKWLEKTRTKIQAVADSSLIDDEGGYGEGSLAYASMTVSNMFGYITPNTDTNVQDLPFSDRAAYDKVEDLAVYLMDMSMPKYKDNQWGDGGNYTTGYTGTFSTVLQDFDNEYLKYAVSGGTEGTIPPYTSVLYRNYRRMVMRSGWGDNDNYLFTELDGATVNHSHKDDNGIIVSAYGQYLLTDQLFFSYGTGPVKTYLESTRAHNTIEIDNASQGTRTKGTVKYWESNDIYDHTTNESLAYRGGSNEKHTRDILYIRPGFWIVGDYVKPNDSDTAQHNYKQHWHMLPDANISLDEDSLTTRTNFVGTANIQVVQANPEDMDATLNNGYYVGTTADYVTYEQQAAGPVIFNTILYPEKAGENVEVTAETLPLENVEKNGATAMHINIDNYTENQFIRADYYLVHDESQKAVRTFANYETDARSAYVERDAAGNLTRLIVQDGTYVKDLDKNVYLFKSQVPVEQIGFELSYGSVVRDTSADVDMNQLTFYADNTSNIVNVYQGTTGANTVKTPVSYQTSGRYIYFGSTPIEEETEEPDASPTPTPTTKPGSNVNGGISSGGGGGGGIGSVKPQGTGTSPENTPTPTPTPDTTPPEETPNPAEQLKEEIQGHWGETELAKMIDKGILKGSDGSLALETSVTRAEFTAMLVRGLELETKSYEGGFSDVNSGDWFADYVQTAVEQGIISGMGDGTFAGNQVISREEMAKMLVSAFEMTDGGKTVPGEVSTFVDREAVSVWAIDYVEKAAGYGLLQGDEERRFLPQNGAQRDQAAVAIGRMLEKLGKL